jgi:hypothetical protein
MLVSVTVTRSGLRVQCRGAWLSKLMATTLTDDLPIFTFDQLQHLINRKVFVRCGINLIRGTDSWNGNKKAGSCPCVHSKQKSSAIELRSSIYVDPSTMKRGMWTDPDLCTTQCNNFSLPSNITVRNFNITAILYFLWLYSWTSSLPPCRSPVVEAGVHMVGLDMSDMH